MDRLWNGLNIILKQYFWVTCKANEAYKFKWGTQIGRIQYKAKGSVDYTEIPRFSHMSYANKSGTSIGEVETCRCSIV